MPDSPEYDVIVVGAGPAGSRSAEVLASAGYNVLLTESDPQIGFPVHCTGIVSEECFERYDLPQELVIRTQQSFVLRSPQGRGLSIPLPSKAFVLNRPDLDRVLAERAQSSGARLLMSTKIDEVTWENPNVLVRGMTEGQGVELSARCAVIATGFGSPLARDFWPVPKQNVLSGCQMIVRAPDIKEIEVFTGKFLGQGGFGWLVPWRDGYALTGLLTRKHTVSLMYSLVEKLQSEGRIEGTEEQFYCRPIPLGTPTTTYKDGMVGVGDAVGQVKPTSGGGIYYALLAADCAGKVIGDSLMANDLSAANLKRYDDEWQAILSKEISQGVMLRSALERLPDEMVEVLHRMIGVPFVRNMIPKFAPSFDWHSRPITQILGAVQSIRGAR